MDVKDLLIGLDEIIKLHPGVANIKNLKGIFSYDIKFNP
jgi:hypothetical protein